MNNILENPSFWLEHPSLTTFVRRDGSITLFEPERIVRAVSLGIFGQRTEEAENPYREQPEFRYGLNAEDYDKARMVAAQVCKRLVEDGAEPEIERCQDHVEAELGASGEVEVMKSFRAYRMDRAVSRLDGHDGNALADYIGIAKYSRYLPEEKRRETFPEAVSRVAKMQRTFYADKGSGVSDKIDAAFAAVARKEVLPSMRSLQFGGEAVLKNHTRIYNCSATSVNRPRVFGEAFYALLCGTGVGFSVQKQHIEQLPAIPAAVTGEPRTYVVPDSVEGWAYALNYLVHSKYEGYPLTLDLSLIRAKGTPLKTSGGKAPGPEPLQKALDSIGNLFDQAKGRQLKPIEAYDVLMYSAKAVLSGGVRRSATICLFSPDDEEMMNAKTGNWFETNLQRSASNNSAVIERDTTTYEQFGKLFAAQKAFGEPGFYFTNNKEYGTNPCVEIGINPSYSITSQEDSARLQANAQQWLARTESQVPVLDPYSLQLRAEMERVAEGQAPTSMSGFQFCNLSTINGAKIEKPEQFYEACRHAAVLGTLQAGYSELDFLGPISESITQREALLGVSICGVLDSPRILLNPEVLSKGAQIVKETNQELAQELGIEAAARTTCVKPEGTSSLLLQAASGIHPHHAKAYFRRVQANRIESVYQCFKEKNPHMTEASVYNPEGDDVISFVMRPKEGALTKDDVDALQLLSMVREVQTHWVENGRAHEKFSPGLHHNVSNTVTVQDHEWNEVREKIWANRDHFTGIAMLSHTGDSVYAQAPLQAITNEKGADAWNKIVRDYRPVDYSKMQEASDNTKHISENIACAGGQCELPTPEPPSSIKKGGR